MQGTNPVTVARSGAAPKPKAKPKPGPKTKGNKRKGDEKEPGDEEEAQGGEEEEEEEEEGQQGTEGNGKKKPRKSDPAGSGASGSGGIDELMGQLKDLRNGGGGAWSCAAVGASGLWLAASVLSEPDFWAGMRHATGFIFWPDFWDI